MLSVVTLLINETAPETPITDSLILEIAKGDMESFHSLYEAASGSVYGFALSILKNKHDAEDILQETFLTIHRKAADYLPQGKPMAWIFTIARNLCLTRLKGNGKLTELDEGRATEQAEFSEIGNLEHRLTLEATFKVLTDEERQILMLHAVGGVKFREIAHALDLHLNTVLSKYHRSIKKMKEKLEREGF